jgi:hypothetical protein
VAKFDADRCHTPDWSKIPGSARCNHHPLIIGPVFFLQRLYEHAGEQQRRINPTIPQNVVGIKSRQTLKGRRRALPLFKGSSALSVQIKASRPRWRAGPDQDSHTAHRSKRIGEAHGRTLLREPTGNGNRQRIKLARARRRGAGSFVGIVGLIPVHGKWVNPS